MEQNERQTLCVSKRHLNMFVVRFHIGNFATAVFRIFQMRSHRPQQGFRNVFHVDDVSRRRLRSYDWGLHDRQLMARYFNGSLGYQTSCNCNREQADITVISSFDTPETPLNMSSDSVKRSKH